MTEANGNPPPPIFQLLCDFNLGKLMMGHLVNLLHGTVFFNKFCFNDFPKLFKQRRYSHTGKFAKIHEFNGVPLAWQGTGDLANHVADLFNHEINFSNGGELNGIPHIQTLRAFPREELYGKVLMVRFDSNILLKRECDKKNQSVYNAVHTIKYLHRAGAKIILVSDWNMNTPDLHIDSVAVLLAILVYLRQGKTEET
ncbi:unnamed protein product [Sphenostylis stenocarpa]|uniref:phosphoglycerate kinase n=1 Tax=Sphenostylis stenocarpa TaxID=92480 RepID=A0AA86S929_9FABA|nr:unnamed protein product [Sphenostylis stenocarpa]